MRELFKLGGQDESTGSQGPKKIMSSMKRRPGLMGAQAVGGSPVMELVVRHLGDEVTNLEISAQAFWKVSCQSGGLRHSLV